ncbi:MAG TPA: hypothetical protein DDZ51_06095 [Planctomycetaceae bacterium]|nr:hypothetical protein [Planctomycetaceae bacterium]
MTLLSRHNSITLLLLAALMKSANMLETFVQVQNENRNVANMILNAALATLVNSLRCAAARD